MNTDIPCRLRTTICCWEVKICFPLSISAQGDTKLSIDSNDNSRSTGNVVWADANTFLDTREISVDIGHPIPSLKVFSFADLETATSNFSLYMPFGLGCFGNLFLGWVDENTFAPLRDGIGITVAVKRCYLERSQGNAKALIHAVMNINLYP